MKNISFLGFLISFVFIFSSPLFAEDIIEPEDIMTADSWLTSDPQPGANYHVIRVCKDYEMIEDCTQCNYEASMDGSLKIPTLNRCVFRADEGNPYTGQVNYNQSYNLYYQLKSASYEGLESEWTEPKIVSIVKRAYNESNYGSIFLYIQYNHE